MIWTQHPLNITTDKSELHQLMLHYLQHLAVNKYITLAEMADIELLPYRGVVGVSTFEKMQFPNYALIFECEEETFYPLILRKLYHYYRRMYENGYQRRKILNYILEEAPSSEAENIKQCAYGGYSASKLIEMYHLHMVYRNHPKQINQIWWCVFGKDMRRK